MMSCSKFCKVGKWFCGVVCMRDRTGQKNGGWGSDKREKTLSFLYRTDIGLLD